MRTIPWIGFWLTAMDTATPFSQTHRFPEVSRGPNVRSRPLLWDGRTTCSWDLIPAASELHCSTASFGAAKLNGLDPALYLRTVLAPIAEHPINRIAELLPLNLSEGGVEL